MIDDFRCAMPSFEVAVMLENCPKMLRFIHEFADSSEDSIFHEMRIDEAKRIVSAANCG